MLSPAAIVRRGIAALAAAVTTTLSVTIIIIEIVELLVVTGMS